MKFLLKSLLAFFVTLSFVVVASSQRNTKQNERGYLGSVVSVRTEIVEYWDDNGKLRHGKRNISTIERFDSNGRLREERHFADDGSVLWQDKYVYDRRGRLTEASGTHSKFVYLPNRRIYEYDANGNLVAENGFDSQGKLVNKSEYAYDEKGRKIRWTSMSYHTEEHSKPHQWTYDYYEDGRVREEHAFSDEGTGFQPTDSLGNPHRKMFLYNSQNKPAFVLLFTVNGVFAGLESTIYDRPGNELEEVQYKRDGSLKDKTKYTYRFDGHGNPVVQKTYEWDLDAGAYHLTEISYQVIEYRK